VRAAPCWPSRPGQCVVEEAKEVRSQRLVHGLTSAPAARRALGDIGNLVGPFHTRCNVGKENAAKKGAAAGPLVDGALQVSVPLPGRAHTRLPGAQPCGGSVVAQSGVTGTYPPLLAAPCLNMGPWVHWPAGGAAQAAAASTSSCARAAGKERRRGDQASGRRRRRGHPGSKGAPPRSAHQNRSECQMRYSNQHRTRCSHLCSSRLMYCEHAHCTCAPHICYSSRSSGRCRHRSGQVRTVQGVMTCARADGTRVCALQGAVAKQRSSLRPRDAAAATTSGAAQAPAAKEVKVAGRSMSALLQSRSEAAAADRRAAAAEPASPMPDIDRADAADPLQASEYVGDIFTYYRRVEPQFRVAPDYMLQQVRARGCAAACWPVCVGAPRGADAAGRADGHQRQDARHPGRLAG